MIFRRRIATWLTLVVISLPTAMVYAKERGGVDEAAVENSGRLTLERIFEQREFDTKSYAATWQKQGESLWRWEATESGEGQDLVQIDARTGDRQVVVAATELIPSNEQRPLTVDAFEWSQKQDKLLIFTESKRVWRLKTRGDYWVYDRTSRVLTQLGGDAAPASLMFAKFSPDGNSVAYVRDRELWLESLLDHSIRSLTPSDSADLIHGTFDWVYEEELSARDGFRWSPDGREIAYWQINTSGVPTFTLVNNTDSFYPTIHQFAYPKTGQNNPAGRIFVVSVESGARKWLPIPGDPREHYLCRMEWDGPECVIVQQLNRLQNTNTVYRVDVHGGKVEVVLTETDDAWVDVHDEMKWRTDRKEFTWVSERDGWRHVYLLSADGQRQQLITLGDFDVIELLHVDEVLGHAYFIASPDNPTQAHLYRVNLDGSDIQRVTPAGQTGVHGYQISPSGRLAIHQWSAFNRPPRVELVELPEHKVVRRLETNRPLRKKLNKLERGRHEFFRIDLGDGVELDAWCIYPTHFDARQKYPLLIHVYGEPAGQTVLDRWGGDNFLWHQLLAQQGYFIVSIDNRGTPAPRGRAGARRYTGEWEFWHLRTKLGHFNACYRSGLTWTPAVSGFGDGVEEAP